jgi:hypothetical protein
VNWPRFNLQAAPHRNVGLGDIGFDSISRHSYLLFFWQQIGGENP